MKLTPKQLNLRRQKDAYFSKLRWTRAQIAARLDLTEGTVKQYSRMLFAKLGVHSKLAAAVKVMGGFRCN